MSTDMTYNWYYMSCVVHRKKVREVPGGYTCTDCKELKQLPIVRYELTAMVADSTGNVKCALLEGKAARILDISVEQMFQLSNEEDGDAKVEKKLEELIGRTYEFELEINDYNLYHGSSTLIVTQIHQVEYAEESRYLLGEILKLKCLLQPQKKHNSQPAASAVTPSKRATPAMCSIVEGEEVHTTYAKKICPTM
ncbi:Nucleic acid-binding protein [Corchorus olitorius]|uniref:Nucleic acid-binding protein n=1 Tax=Corchorus olitorius TaxID=93759 RepID=A0A1R3G0J3_9ROSI|nr:Nucleic acid-binding protein [Corchorus olitorius]